MKSCHNRCSSPPRRIARGRDRVRLKPLSWASRKMGKSGIGSAVSFSVDRDCSATTKTSKGKDAMRTWEPND